MDPREVMLKDDDEQQDAIPLDLETLIPWLRERFPEVTPRRSDRELIDLCIARAAVIDLINFLEAKLAEAQGK